MASLSWFREVLMNWDYDRLKEWDFKHFWHPFTQMAEYTQRDPLIIERGEGVYLIDIHGNRYIDGVSSLWVNVHGHNREKINRAIVDQLNKIAHSTTLGISNIPAILLAKKLADITPGDLGKVFFSDTGACAMEIAIKMAYHFWQNVGEKQRKKFVSLRNGYHGDTIGAMSVGGIDLFHAVYRPLLFEALFAPSPYCYRCELGLSRETCGLACLERLEEIVASNKDEIVAIVAESAVQAAGGMIVMPDGYMKGLREIADRYGVLLVLDEVAVGFGRTGKMWGCEHEGVVPDIMAVAKGITGGYLPVAATITTERIYNAFLGDYTKTFYHGHTYTGNPLGCAAALASIELFEEEKTLEKLQPKIEHLRKRLEEFWELEHVGDIRQKGFMVGIELVEDRKTKKPYDPSLRMGFQVIYKARERGVVIRPLGDVIVILPPLVITIEELDTLIDVVKWAIKEVTEA